MTDVTRCAYLVPLQAFLKASKHGVRQADPLTSEVKACQVHARVMVGACLVREMLVENRQHGLHAAAPSADLILTRGMNTQIIDVQGVPVTPVGADQTVERVHKVDVPVDSHVVNPLGTPKVPMVLVTKLGDYEDTGGRGAFTGVKGVR